MKERFTGIAAGAGVFMFVGVAGAACELYLDTHFHFTEPLSPSYGVWSFFHRAKFYGALGVAGGAVVGAAWFGVARLVSLLARNRRPTHAVRAVYAGAFAAAFAGTPLWFFLGNWDIKLGAQDTARIISMLGVVFVWLVLFFSWLFSLSRRANAWGRRVMAAVGYAALALYVGNGLATWAARPRPARGLPDVVIITLDACRADEFGRRADGTTLTPNIDRFAAGAYVFRQCRAQATWTSPSLATLLTGQYPFVHGATADRPLGVSQPTLAEILYNAGYDTEAVVANRLCHRGGGLARGFSRYFYWKETPLLRAVGYYETYYAYSYGLLFEKHYTSVFKNEGHTPVITDNAVRILNAKRIRPLFLWCHYLDPHSPYLPPRRYVAPADRKLIGKIPQTDRERGPILKRHYDGEVRYVDAELARVFAVLPRNSLVVISSDHGEEFWEHGDYDHGKTLYDETLRVPLVLRVPGAGHAVTDAPVGLVDVAPTILSALNLKVPSSMQGRDVAGAPRAASWDYPVFFGSSMLLGGRRYGVLYRKYKLMAEQKQSIGDAEYYDLAADPGEKFPIPGRESAARKKAESLLRDWIENNRRTALRFGFAPFSRAVNDRLRAMGYIQ